MFKLFSAHGIWQKAIDFDYLLINIFKYHIFPTLLFFLDDEISCK